MRSRYKPDGPRRASPHFQWVTEPTVSKIPRTCDSPENTLIGIHQPITQRIPFNDPRKPVYQSTNNRRRLALATAADLEKQLPPYLGFGNLLPETISSGVDACTAAYGVQGSVVYRVEAHEDSCKLTELLDDSCLGVSMGRTLSDAFFQQLLSIPPYHHPRFKGIYEDLTRLGNVEIRFASRMDQGFLFFPAGYLFHARHPIQDDLVPKWHALREQFQSTDSPTGGRVEALLKGAILRLEQTGRVTFEPTNIAEYSMMLLSLSSTVRRIVTAGVVGQGREYRLLVQDSGQVSPNDLRIFLGDPARGFLTFAVTVTETDGDAPEKISREFFENSVKFLDGLKAQ